MHAVGVRARRVRVRVAVGWLRRRGGSLVELHKVSHAHVKGQLAVAKHQARALVVGAQRRVAAHGEARDRARALAPEGLGAVALLARNERQRSGPRRPRVLLPVDPGHDDSRQ